ncbi:hypothetical protein TVAG_196690 [Trichomonas vaginalis G3]|uniref:Uncharacterized protein n=1 Tax=Trichomonas vaginalis (strain ATCC PRA-98 / G3) TaxID=412133 RepID=A2FCY8_TRIV3|nr:armadillo (ARM) repeat-containing protein family [Trichomonas vaginalis G3]EAX97226.1 hypothetical protein TVAG_196690 [Trichomonas vaginalis G3]KAI5509533.1 armadillo (ARM) repeat-containing protein family [Trichomonas vaginalis G3]|eukprot:XP_001310156.1 hypothetical protein [Trichomonas vaginalis G3]
MIDEYKDSPFIFTNKLNEPVYDNDGGIVQGYREKDTQFLLNLIHNSSYSEKLFQQLMVYVTDRPVIVSKLKPDFAFKLISFLKEDLYTIDVLKCISSVSSEFLANYTIDFKFVLLRSEFFDLIYTIIYQRHQDNLLIDSIFNILINCCNTKDYSFTIQLMESNIIEQLIKSKDLNEYREDILIILQYFVQMPLKEYKFSIYDDIVEFIGNSLYIDDVKVTIQALIAFRKANENGDVIGFLFCNQVICNVIREKVSSYSIDCSKQALKTLNSLIKNGQEIVDIIGKFMTVEELLGNLTKDLKIVKHVIATLISLRQNSEDPGVLYHLYTELFSVDFNNTFSSTSLHIKESVVILIETYNYNPPIPVTKIYTESVLMFLANFVEVGEIKIVFTVAKLINEAIDASQSDWNFLSLIQKVFEENVFDIIDETLNNIDSNTPRHEEIENCLQHLLDTFTPAE